MGQQGSREKTTESTKVLCSIQSSIEVKRKENPRGHFFYIVVCERRELEQVFFFSLFSALFCPLVCLSLFPFLYRYLYIHQGLFLLFCWDLEIFFLRQQSHSLFRCFILLLWYAWWELVDDEVGKAAHSFLSLLNQRPRSLTFISNFSFITYYYAFKQAYIHNTCIHA